MQSVLAAAAAAFALTGAALADDDQAAQDQAAVATIVEGVAVFADRGEFDALERLFADEVRVDYSSLTGAPAAAQSAESLMAAWAGLLPGFDRTRHALSGVTVAIDGDGAQASATVVADHWIDDISWRLSGRYDYALARQDGDWAITAMTLTVEGEDGTRDVFGLAAAAVEADPPAYLTARAAQQD